MIRLEVCDKGYQWRIQRGALGRAIFASKGVAGRIRSKGRGWQKIPEYFYFYTSMILLKNFNNEGSVDVDVDVECPYITEDFYYIASNNCRP